MKVSPEFFYLAEIAIGILSVGAALYALNRKNSESGFKLREADRIKSADHKSSLKLKEETKTSKKSAPPLLNGIRIDGEAHEILGISKYAGPDEIQQAYKLLMKQYHPDRVGRPGSREWIEAQKIAKALNQAKADLLKAKGH